MSDEEEENFCFYGKPLDPYDEDAFPKKRPITVEEQVATDSKGRRRFHGAFTGGFSAGFFNTVGSLEGWLPAEFKSSRGDKQKHVAQNPEDFMDDEDMGEFGFAPQSIRATKDYDTSKKRKRKVFSDGPIPGEPVLHSLLTAGNETVGYLLLKNIGMKEKIKTRDEECSSDTKVYGCEIPKTSAETVEMKDFDLPEFYNNLLIHPKNDTFTLGYVGLDKSKVNLFRSSDLVVHEKNKKLSIRGQAFGVGALENDDDDIYSKEDMSNYDFELTKEREKPKGLLNESTERVFGLFVKAKINSYKKEIYPPPVIPKSFTGTHKVKKSRFEPLKTTEAESTVDRKKVDSMVRAKILDEETNENVTTSKSIPSVSKSLSNYVKKEETDEKKRTTSREVPKPATFDPSSLWDDRFVTGTQEDETTNILAPVKKYESDHYAKEMKDAAKMKMYGPLTRISEDWQPCSLLCKRFNVPEPFSDKPSTSKNRVKMKNLIFEYQKHHEENVTFKSGLSEVTSESIKINAANEVKPPSSSGNTEETENSNKISELPVTEIKQEIVEEDDVNENVENIKTEQPVEIIDITDRLNLEEKEDLFRSVFMSSSESEDELNEDNNKESEKKDETSTARELELKANLLGEDLQLPKIKPIKEGILSGINFKSTHVFNKPTIEKKDNDTETNQVANKDSDTSQYLYGPKLPENILVKNGVQNTSQKISFNNYTDSSSDEWVEKDDAEKIKRKKHKKNKSSHKKKHKHKKSKKKH